jgi:hypothetical protein
MKGKNSRKQQNYANKLLFPADGVKTIQFRFLTGTEYVFQIFTNAFCNMMALNSSACGAEVGNTLGHHNNLVPHKHEQVAEAEVACIARYNACGIACSGHVAPERRS